MRRARRPSSVWLTTTRSTPGGTAAKTARASSTVRERGESEAITTPTASAPASTAARASSGRVMPQIFTKGGGVMAGVSALSRINVAPPAHSSRAEAITHWP